MKPKLHRNCWQLEGRGAVVDRARCRSVDEAETNAMETAEAIVAAAEEEAAAAKAAAKAKATTKAKAAAASAASAAPKKSHERQQQLQNLPQDLLGPLASLL